MLFFDNVTYQAAADKRINFYFYVIEYKNIKLLFNNSLTLDMKQFLVYKTKMY